MTEVFRNAESGKIVNQKPGYAGSDGGAGQVERVFSSFEENLDNLRAIVRLVRTAKPGAKIVMTVWPVALAATFGEEDIVVTNTESKCLLRAAIGQVTREFEDVIYFPAFELVTSLDAERAFRADRRNVLMPVVEHIMQVFQEAYFIDTEQS
ncbi:GSCFA domain-containing protein [Pararhizobium sp. A13]|uniref:GSCFA domain-containing protein n=1 Tax=Pararhizobium sp. A13 TaxID=3133975 RepID=UPI0032559401